MTMVTVHYPSILFYCRSEDDARARQCKGDGCMHFLSAHFALAPTPWHSLHTGGSGSSNLPKSIPHMGVSGCAAEGSQHGSLQ